ncbi:MAG TPA: hypothetical protein VEX43_09045 [Chthoniobacterales bacterium]|nr:hypothetical protein [Chthoniobacterales bacterium]
MKPLSQISAQRRSHRADAPVGLRPTQPVMDYHFHAPAGDLRAANNRLQLAPPALPPSFRHLSSEFLATEMKRDYLAEASFFAVFVGVSAWPIVSMLQALAQLAK